MVENDTNKLGRWSAIGFGLIFIANILLLVMLWQARLNRLEILPGDVAFFTPNIMMIAGGALVLVLTSSGFVLTRQLQKLSISIIWIWVTVSLVGLIAATLFVPAFAIYAAAFLLWLIILDCGLLMIAYRQQLSKLDSSAIVRNLATMLAGIVVTLVMLEIVLRVYFGMFGTLSQKVSYIFSVPDILAVSNRYEGQPYTNYGLSANHTEHNSYGFRGDDFTVPKPENTYRIFTLGGSTTYGEGVTPDNAYPALLEDILHGDYGYTHIEVINGGVNAYSSFDSLANLSYHVLDYEPDMVIVYHGVNDVRARLVAPEDYTGRNLQRGFWNPYALQQSLNPSVVVRFATINMGLVQNPTRFETVLGTDGSIDRCGLFETTCALLGDVPAEDILAQNPPTYFERNLRNMHAIATANQADFVMSTWLYFGGETELPNPMMLDHMQAAVDEQNEVIRSLGNELDAPVIDFAAVDDLNEGLYWQDGMHLTASGTREQAEYYAAFLTENDYLPTDSN